MSIGSYSNTQGYSSSSGQNLYIGDADTFFANKFTGLIDDVRIYNYARSADQVMQDYNAGASRLGAQSAGEKDPWGGAMPIAWWKLDENTGVLAQDASGNGNNGTLVNSPTWTQGKNGPCLNFNGSSGQVNIGTPAILNQDFTALTLEAWIYANSSPIGSDSAVAGKFTVYGFTLHTGTPNLYFYINNGGNGLAPNYSSYLNAWHHIAGTFDGTTQKIYIDGKFVASKASSATSTGTGGSFGIGGDGAGSTIFNGKIDDVKFYNYCRTQAQIAWDYNKGKPIAYWKLEENTGTIAYDSSGNGNNSIVWTGAPTWAQGKYGYGLSFDNEGEAVAARVENLPAGSSPRTISCWFKPTSFDDIVLGSICGYPYNAYGGGVNQWFEIKYSDAGDKKFGFHLYNTHYLTTNIFEPNNWYHLDAVYDGTNVKLYVNGKLEIDQAVALNTSVNPTGANFNIYGEINQPTDYKRPGFIDDVRVYNYARTADQVMQDYNAGAAARLGD